MAQTTEPKIVISCGEPAGIGPDIVIKALQQNYEFPITVISDPNLLKTRAKQLGHDINVRILQQATNNESHQSNVLSIIPVSLSERVITGNLDIKNSQYTLECINLATDMCLQGHYQAMVTAPVHKGIINDAGIQFSGHTEWIANRCGKYQPVMMLANESMRICLATTHLPLKMVSNHISRQSLTIILTTIHDDLRQLFGITRPVISVCGLNPHAGESGHLGDEEINIIMPCLERLRKKGFNLIGPLSADTAFTPDQLQKADAILTMYHDQGLPVIKHSDFGKLVNITLGLPIIRTSVDHGTAIDIAGSGNANENSLITAINQAVSLSKHKHVYTL